MLAARIDRLPPEEKRPPPDRRRDRHRGALVRCCRPLPMLPERRSARGLTHLQAAEFLYETAPSSRARVYLQARPHPRGGLWRPPARAAAGAPCPHRRGPGSTRRGPVAEQVERLAHHALRGEVWDKAVAYCPAGGGEGHGCDRPPRGRGVLRAGASVLSPSAGAARHQRAGHRSPLCPAHGALAVR